MREVFENVHTKDVVEKDCVIHLPLYMTPLLLG